MSGNSQAKLEEKEQEQANALPSQNEMFTEDFRQDRRMGISMDGTLKYIRGEEWKELKV